MATKTDIYELRKKEENDFYTIDDFNENMDTVETALTTFDDTGNAEGITSFTDMLTKMVTGNKLAITLRNLKAGLQYVLHTGSIVNNCVTDNANLPLAAAQGKALQDQVTKLNSDLRIKKFTDIVVETIAGLPVTFASTRNYKHAIPVVVNHVSYRESIDVISIDAEDWIVVSNKSQTISIRMYILST